MSVCVLVLACVRSYVCIVCMCVLLEIFMCVKLTFGMLINGALTTAFVFEWQMDIPRHPTHHDDVTTWKRSLRYWPFVRGIHRSPVCCPHKRPIIRAFSVSFVVSQDKLLNIQSSFQWPMSIDVTKIWANVFWLNLTFDPSAFNVMCACSLYVFIAIYITLLLL